MPRVCSTKHNASEVLEIILEAATDSRRWYHVLEHLRQELNLDGIALSEYHLATKQGKIGSHVGFNPAFVRLYEERFCKDDPCFADEEQHVAGAILVRDGSAPSEPQSTTSFHANWLKPQGFARRLCGVIRRQTDHVVCLEMMRGPQRDGYSPDDCLFAKRLLPHFDKALKCNDYSWQTAILRNVVDSLPIGVMAVDKTGKILLANRPAVQELERGKGLLTRGARLFATASNTNIKLQTAITAAAADLNMPGETLIIRRGGHLAPTWIAITPLGRMLRKVVGQETQVALIFLSLPERLSQPLVTILKTSYGLTPTEEKLALLIFEGYRLAGAAERLGISMNTVRTHMKRIYTKTKTSHQSELVCVLLTGPLGVLNLSNADAA